MPTNTIRLHRIIRAEPEKIYRAFLDADAKAKFLPPNGFTGKVHHLDANVGGTYKMSFTNFTTGAIHSFGGNSPELTPNEPTRKPTRLDNQTRPVEIKTTITLTKALGGTDQHIARDAVPPT